MLVDWLVMVGFLQRPARRAVRVEHVGHLLVFPLVQYQLIPVWIFDGYILASWHVEGFCNQIHNFPLESLMHFINIRNFDS